jgi:hypothetical protein
MNIFQAPMDPVKLCGEACNPDGSLKEAHEIEWFNDPDDASAITICKSVDYVILLFSSPY